MFPTYELVETTIFKILHRVIDGVVCFETFQHLYYIGMMELGEISGFSCEFLAVVSEQTALAAACHSCAFTTVDFLHEEFLDGYLYFGIDVA